MAANHPGRRSDAAYQPEASARANGLPRLRFGLVWVVCLLAQAGCESFDQHLQPTKVASTNASKQVKLGGDSLQLGDLTQPGITPDGFTRRIYDLMVERKFTTAQYMIQRYPDIALEILRNTTSQPAPDVTVQYIARLYDQECCQVDAQAGWAALLKDRVEHPERYAAHDAARKRLLADLQSNHAVDKVAGTLRVPSGVAVPLEMDALQLTGEAQLLAGHPKEAVTAFAAAYKLAGTAFPHQSVKILLELSDAQRRAGNEALAVAAWKDAVEVAAGVLHSGRSMADPTLWERVAYMRPVTAAWTASVMQLQQKQTSTVAQTSASEPSHAQSSANEAILWAMIGEWHLHRAEAQGALVAFKHAEGFATDENSHDRLQIGEARALAAMGQRASAVAILTRLAENSNPEIAQPALAVYGSLLFNEGQTTQALALLRKARRLRQGLAGSRGRPRSCLPDSRRGSRRPGPFTAGSKGLRSRGRIRAAAAEPVE